VDFPNKLFCPFPLRGNTSTCRSLHLFAAFNVPSVHCPHVSRQSVPCTDSCLSSCVGCDKNNGFCAGSINIDASVNYFCKCKDGYTGDGHTCTPNSCTANWQCPSPTYSTTCTNGICQCANSFEWNTTTAAQQAGAVCACNSSSTLYWNGNVAECIPIGRCRQRWQCPQDYNSVTCIQYGQNAFIPYDTCVCNFGFDGGFSIGCGCAVGRSIQWSTLYAGNICIAPGQCTDGFQCSSGVCHISPGQPIGSCA